MKQASSPQHKPQIILVLSKFSLILAGLGFASLLMSPHQDTARAQDIKINKLTTGTSWGAGSFPVEKFQAYTSPFGYRHSATGGSGWEFHRGLDMAAPEGSYIRNWWAGRVLKVADGTTCGTYIVIQSGDWQHTYCHMKGHVETANGYRYLVDREGGIQMWEGEIVRAGARIGRVGMTGRTTGPHLHWGLKYASNLVDPALILQAMYAQQSGQTQYSASNPKTVQESPTLQDSGD